MKTENPLPLKYSLSTAFITSVILSLLTGVVSISGILFRDLFYPIETLYQTFVPNDMINLLIGIPILLLSIFWTRRGKLFGLLFWVGALAFNLYIFITYSLALPLSWKSIIYISLILMDIGTLYQLVSTVEGEMIGKILRDQVHEKICGGMLTAFGVLFLLRAILILISTVQNGGIQSQIEFATNIADFIFAPVFMVIGIFLWKKKAPGYVGGLGLLFLASMLFVGLILFLLLQPMLSNTPSSPMDIIIVGVMELICFIPLGLFIRGIVLSGNN